MRRLFTTVDALASGITIDALKWGARTGRWVRVERSVYGEGPEPPTQLDRERARVLASGREARGCLAGVLLGLDSVELDGRPTRRRSVEATLVAGVPCAVPLQVLIDLAALVDDDRWEQALESALRRRLVTIADLEAALPGLTAQRLPGTPTIRRALSRRPPGAPPTESLLETLTVQLTRDIPLLGEPVRQHEVRWPDGTFVARVDLCWPSVGVFAELDGQHHAGQPLHDARRETAVVAATGWLPGRFTWHEIVRIPRSSARRFEQLALQARRRLAA